MTDDDITKVMTSLADSLEKNAAIDKKSIFIHTHVARKNQLYIMGEVVTDWAQVGGTEPTPPAVK